MTEQANFMPIGMQNTLFYGYTTVPVQPMGAIYSPEEAMREGTLFPELNLPIAIYGKEGWRHG